MLYVAVEVPKRPERYENNIAESWKYASQSRVDLTRCPTLISVGPERIYEFIGKLMKVLDISKGYSESWC